MRTFRFIIIVVSLVLASPRFARAEDAAPDTLTLDATATFADGKIVPGGSAFIIKPLYGPLGLNVISSGTTEFAEALAGLVYFPRPWLSVAGLAGISQADGVWRVAGTLGLGNEDVSSFTVVEASQSEHWARTEFAWRPRSWAGVGFLGDTDLGIGPRIEFNLAVPKAVVHLWGASLYDWGESRASGLLGLRFDL